MVLSLSQYITKYRDVYSREREIFSFFIRLSAGDGLRCSIENHSYPKKTLWPGINHLTIRIGRLGIFFLRAQECLRLSLIQGVLSAFTINNKTGDLKMIVKVQRYVVLGIVCLMGICGMAYGATGGSVDGLDLGSVKCNNRENGQSVRLYPERADWDCEASGMQVGAGNQITQRIRGKALRSNAGIHGVVVGITKIKALRCKNRTTGKTSLQRLVDGVSWSCSDAGLRVFAGNRVDIVIYGYAQGPVPPAPSELSVKAGLGQATLSWNAIADTDHYNVYISTEPSLKLSQETLLATVVDNNFIATGLINGVDYYFVVTAENAYGESNPSLEVSSIPGYIDHNAVSDRSCSNCHDQSPTHPLTTSVCESCHGVAAWIPLLLPMDHSQAMDNCVRCHDNVIATGKSANHIATSDRCELCHSTVSFVALIFDHTNVAGQSCAQSGCHDGRSAVTAKPLTHPVTTDYCEACHNTSAWVPLVFPFDHSQTYDSCQICHNGTIATGKWATHPITSGQCESCHTQASWLPLIMPFNHSEVIAPSCLDGGCHNQSDTPAVHCPTTVDCSTCHTPTVWIDAQPCGTNG